MPIAPDDLRLTAFALGELDDAERPEIEALLDTDPEARAVVEEVRATARLLAEELRTESVAGLAPEHHQTIEIRIEPTPAQVLPVPTKRTRRWAEIAVAAGLLGLAATLAMPAIRGVRSHAPRELALNDLVREKARTPDVRPPSGPPATSEPADHLDLADQGFLVPDPGGTNDLSRSSTRSAGSPPAPAKTRFEAESEFAVVREARQDPTNSAGTRPGQSVGDRQEGRSLRRLDAGRELSGESNFGLRPQVVLRSVPEATLSLSERVSSPSSGPGASGEGRSSLSTARNPNNDVRYPSPVYVPSDEKKPASRPQARMATPAQGRTASGPAEGLKAGLSRPGDKQELASTVQDSLLYSKKDSPAEAGQSASPPPASKAPDLQEKVEAEALIREKAKLESLSKLGVEPSDPKTLGQLIEARRKVMDEAKRDAEAFTPILDNPFFAVSANPLSTFSIDVDTASYSNVRRYLNQNSLPPRDAVRIEELVNYFPYSYPAPPTGQPFSVNCEVARCPWEAGNRLVRIGLKGREIEADKRPPSNLVFLIDVSGSMEDLDKLPLLKAGMKLLVEQLGENDRVAIVVYAAQEGLALAPTRCDRKAEILSTLEQLRAGGSTNGSRGILLAYDLAVRNFIDGGTNRVILATDGDFNVGVTEGPQLDKLIEEKRATGVSLSVLGFGQGNVKHDKLESLADKGNGQYSFIDSIKEARKVLVEQVGGSLVTIAKDVKVQVQFEPDRASAYRLIGYENRRLENRHFEDDTKDAGEIGAGHFVTALYEVVPIGQGGPAIANIEASRLAQQAAKGNAKLLEIRLRYKAPDGDVSRLLTCPADDDGRDFAAASGDFRFASAVAGFGMLLRDSPHKGTLTWDGLAEIASGAVGGDPGGYRGEFLGLVRKASTLSAR